jgi:hypothetical protein
MKLLKCALVVIGVTVLIQYAKADENEKTVCETILTQPPTYECWKETRVCEIEGGAMSCWWEKEN